jgi:hypothetical protein
MFRPYKAILRQLLIDLNRHTVSAHTSIYLHATTARRYLYAHTSLTLFSYCGVHAVFPFCAVYFSGGRVPLVFILWYPTAKLSNLSFLHVILLVSCAANSYGPAQKSEAYASKHTPICLYAFHGLFCPNLYLFVYLTTSVAKIIYSQLMG